MASISFADIRVPRVAAAVLRFKQQKCGPVTFKLRNEGESTLTFQLQDSADNVTYTNLGGASSVVSGGRVDASAVLTRSYLQMVCGGNTYMKVDIAYEGLFLEGNIDVLVISTSSGGWPVQPTI